MHKIVFWNSSRTYQHSKRGSFGKFSSYFICMVAKSVIYAWNK